MGDSAELDLCLEAVAENIAFARDAVADRARALGLDRRAVDDLRTAVSEAATNVVRHAYPEVGGDRPMEIEMRTAEDGLQICVRDHGVGIGTIHGAPAGGLRTGLLVVGALSCCFQLRSTQGHGTELRMRFPAAPTPYAQ
jgi:anti-sigma regulatory factor (Ser/Thr protein kinase)